MAHPLVVHCKKEKFDVYIGRKHKDFPEGSKWANPFYLEEEDRDKILAAYANYLYNNEELLSQIHELKGKVLGCWCGRNKKCHGDILAELANDESLWSKEDKKEIE